MATTRQKSAARRNIKRARSIQSRRAKGARIQRMSHGSSTRRGDRMSGQMFAFARKRKEPINDARHVRNAVARFDQVEGVTNAERDRAWKRIREAARRFGVKIEARGWRSLMKGGKTGRARRRR
ncbi:MAG TPA: DUF6582 domain-containing protein [Gemmatimonadales bacterium]|nr:DUF6582 domain-containing protein [Gemmatimonadales bacterium]